MEPVFWKPAVKDLLELILNNGHSLSAFDPPAPDILPSGKLFTNMAKCSTCGGLICIDWDGRDLNARGALLSESCKKA